MKVYTKLAMLSLFVFLLQSSASAQTTPSTSPLAKFREKLSEMAKPFHFSGSTKFQYDDNIFLDPATEKDDLIFVISPGVVFFDTYNDGDTTIGADYHVDIERFVSFSSENRNNHYLTGELNQKFKDDFALSVADNFASLSTRSDTEFTNRVERIENQLISTLSKEMNRLSLQATYTYFIREFQQVSTKNLDRHENNFSFYLSYRVAPKHTVFTEYKHNFIEYENETFSRDGDVDEILFGLSSEIIPNLVTTSKIGYMNRDYVGNGADLSSLVAYVEGNYSLDELTAIIFGYTHSAAESTFATNTYLRYDSLRAGMTRRLTEKLVSSAGFSYQFNKYPNKVAVGGSRVHRDDDLIDIDAGLTYEVNDNIFLNGKYEFLRRNSNQNIFDYDDNRLTLEVSAVF